jgi:hypothetical protein
MRRLLGVRYVLVAGAKDAIPAWFQHAAVSKKFTEDTPKRYLRFLDVSCVNHTTASLFSDIKYMSSYVKPLSAQKFSFHRSMVEWNATKRDAICNAKNRYLQFLELRKWRQTLKPTMAPKASELTN